MKINWKCRVRNPVFWAHIAVAVITPMLTHFGMNWAQVTTWSSLFGMVGQAFQNPVIVVAVAISLWNCILDPTTKGISDSGEILGGTATTKTHSTDSKA